MVITKNTYPDRLLRSFQGETLVILKALESNKKSQEFPVEWHNNLDEIPTARYTSLGMTRFVSFEVWLS